MTSLNDNRLVGYDSAFGGGAFKRCYYLAVANRRRERISYLESMHDSPTPHQNAAGQLPLSALLATGAFKISRRREAGSSSTAAPREGSRIKGTVYIILYLT